MKFDTALEIFQPGFRIDLVVTMDLLTESIEVRQARIFAADHDRIILGQTDPPLSPDDLGRTLLVSFLDCHNPDRPPLRWAYETELSEVLADYSGTSPELTGPALVLTSPKGEIHRESLRLTYRIKGVHVATLAVDIPSIPPPVTLVDISMGGFLASAPPGSNPLPGEKLPCTIQFDVETSVSGLAEVKNICPNQDTGGFLVSFRFIPPDLRTARLFHRRIFRMMSRECAQDDL